MGCESGAAGWGREKGSAHLAARGIVIGVVALADILNGLADAGGEEPGRSVAVVIAAPVAVGRTAGMTSVAIGVTVVDPVSTTVSWPDELFIDT